MSKDYCIPLNKALDCFQLNAGRSNLFVKTVYYGPDEISITSKDKYFLFQDAVTGMLEGEFGKKISKKFLISLIHDRIYEKLKSGSSFDKDDSAKLRAHIKGLPLKRVRVIKGVQGAIISPASPPLKMGRFTFYDWNRHVDLVKGDYADDFSSIIFDRANHSLVVECEVECAEDEKAIELAEIEFRSLEALMTFLIGRRGTDYEFGIKNYFGARSSKTYVISDEGVSYDARTDGALQDLNLSDEFFTNPSEPRERLIRLEEKTANALERKILRSVEWISQAITEVNAASSFMKAATALEVLFATNEKGVISPSLMSKFAEGCAQILGDTTEKCIAIEKEIKSLYGVRSAVVHYGKNEVSQKELNTLIAYVRAVIFKIMASEPYRGFTSIDELHEHLLKQKYQNPLPSVIK